MTTHLVIPDTHAHPDYSNDRATWLSLLIQDVKPDVVVHLGDSADMQSLASYDSGKRCSVGRTYKADIEAHLDFQSKLWEPIWKKKKKLPDTYFLIGNHEQRIERALDQNHTLVDTLSIADLELDAFYNTVVPYTGDTPGTIEIDGITYAHYFVSGVLGRAISSENPANAIVSKMFSSATCGHSHTLDFCVRTKANGDKVMGLCAGCYQDYTNHWAGETGKLWDRGVAIKRNVTNGAYDLEWVSLNTLRDVYG